VPRKIPRVVVPVSQSIAACVGPQDILRAKMLAFKETVWTPCESLAAEVLPSRPALRAKAHEVRAWQQNKQRFHSMDVCSECQSDLIVDRELAKKVCRTCARPSRFALELFDACEDAEAHNVHVEGAQSNLHKFLAQLEKGTAPAPQNVLSALAGEFSKFHVADTSKVTAGRTQQMLKQCAAVPRTYRQAPQRITRELVGAAVPEFTYTELQSLQTQLAGKPASFSDIYAVVAKNNGVL